MKRNEDSKFADMYGIPVEVLRDGFPVPLRGAPDDEVRGGNLMRVATTDGLAVALSERAPGSDALQVYLVSYMAPKEAQVIEEMAEDTKTKQSEGAAAAGPAFVIANERVLQAKVLALMAMRGEIANINITMQEVRAKEAAPYYIPKAPLWTTGCQPAST
ncbi:unnamed protein product [Miscanthus lutarioriparius]|uniref:Uncharacterized protein n=1 Tax=Miscanthus lutarioriparius TaxID=422564 RepID=A0A811RF14_9POAL|nr:unnamed protein product [Miscanthus lutarioriparius]